MGGQAPDGQVTVGTVTEGYAHRRLPDDHRDGLRIAAPRDRSAPEGTAPRGRLPIGTAWPSPALPGPGVPDRGRTRPPAARAGSPVPESGGCRAGPTGRTSAAKNAPARGWLRGA